MKDSKTRYLRYTKLSANFQIVIIISVFPTHKQVQQKGVYKKKQVQQNEIILKTYLPKYRWLP